MCNMMKTICALAILVCPATAQNEIDHVATLYPSGYGKMAIDGDTLYINILNGHGVERYDIADPTNPILIDREEVSGFDQIDFERRLMAKQTGDSLFLYTFTDFADVVVRSGIPARELPYGYYDWPTWKLSGNYLFTARTDDSLRSYNVTDLSSPILMQSIQVMRTPISAALVFGSTVCVILSDSTYTAYWDIYDISDPNDIYYSRTGSSPISPVGGFLISPGRGDTIVFENIGSAGFSWLLYFVSFAPNDTSHLPAWGEGYNGHPQIPYSNDNAFVRHSSYVGAIANTFNDFVLLGKRPNLPLSFDCTTDNHYIESFQDSICFYQPTYSDTIIMPQVAKVGPAHFGILSSASYGDYILSGAESNGGELLIHHLEPSGNLNLVTALSDIPAINIIIDSSIAFCLCSDKITAIDMSYPENPVFLQQFAGFNGTLVDFAIEDSLIFIATDQSYNIVHFDIGTGFELRSTLDLPGSVITSIVQYHLSYLLKGSVGTILKINPNYGGQPYVLGEYRLPHDNYINMDLGQPGLWASGDSGLDITSFWALDPLGHYGPEYFADARQFNFSGDTVYVADGIGGVKIFTSHWQPEDTLRYIGGYSTGNVVNQLAIIGDNFFVSDYYSLQHLRWGAPTGIDGPEIVQKPERFTLLQNYPNPFNAQTTISYDLSLQCDVTLSIFNVLGEKVDAISAGSQVPGPHEIVWNARDLGSGVYFYQIKAGQSSMIKKMILLK